MIQPITTQRLVLRQVEKLDAPALFALNNNPKVMRYTGDSAFKSLADTEKFIAEYKATFETGFGRMAVVLKNDLTCIGWCGLKQHADGMVDLGYRFLEEHWKQGYATEAALASLQYGFETLQLPVIVGRTARENQGSIKVLEKIGMHYWKAAECDGIADAVYYSISKTQWMKQ